MKNGRTLIWRTVWLVALAPWWTAQADLTRTQTLQLNEGWNAVYLEVTPASLAPDDLFADTPIDVVAAHYPAISFSQFVSDPSADLFKEAGWGVWYAPDRPDAFLKSLDGIYGQQAYLVHARSDYQWVVTGQVEGARIKWVPQAYNLVGFQVHGQAAPTFAQFFQGSPAHRLDRIYRLEGGSWRRVLNPDAQAMKAGEAFWVYCADESKYQGPLSVDTMFRNGLLLKGQAQDIIVRNHTDFPISLTLDHVVSGPHPVPLAFVIQAADQARERFVSVAAPLEDGAWQRNFPPVEAGRAMRIPLEVRLQDMIQAEHSSLLRISTDIGTVNWVPVRGYRNDLKNE